MKEQPFKSFFQNLVLNCKTEILLGILFLSVALIMQFVPKLSQLVNQILYSYFTDDRIALASNIMAIFIGIYFAVLLVIVASRTSITKEMLEKCADKQLSNSMYFGTSICLLFVLISVFAPTDSLWCKYLLFSLLIISITFFIKYSFLIIRLFHINVDAMIKEIDEEEKNATKTMVLLEEIRDTLKKQ